MNINSNTLNALLDSGAAVSLIKEGALSKIPPNYKKERKKILSKFRTLRDKKLNVEG